MSYNIKVRVLSLALCLSLGGSTVVMAQQSAVVRTNTFMNNPRVVSTPSMAWYQELRAGNLSDIEATDLLRNYASRPEFRNGTAPVGEMMALAKELQARSRNGAGAYVKSEEAEQLVMKAMQKRGGDSAPDFETRKQLVDFISSTNPERKLEAYSYLFDRTTSRDEAQKVLSEIVADGSLPKSTKVQTLRSLASNFDGKNEPIMRLIADTALHQVDPVEGLKQLRELASKTGDVSNRMELIRSVYDFEGSSAHTTARGMLEDAIKDPTLNHEGRLQVLDTATGLNPRTAVDIFRQASERSQNFDERLELANRLAAFDPTASESLFKGAMTLAKSYEQRMRVGNAASAVSQTLDETRKIALANVAIDAFRGAADRATPGSGGFDQRMVAAEGIAQLSSVDTPPAARTAYDNLGYTLWRPLQSSGTDEQRLEVAQFLRRHGHSTHEVLKDLLGRSTVRTNGSILGRMAELTDDNTIKGQILAAKQESIRPGSNDTWRINGTTGTQVAVTAEESVKVQQFRQADASHAAAQGAATRSTAWVSRVQGRVDKAQRSLDDAKAYETYIARTSPGSRTHRSAQSAVQNATVFLNGQQQILAQARTSEAAARSKVQTTGQQLASIRSEVQTILSGREYVAPARVVPADPAAAAPAAPVAPGGIGAEDVIRTPGGEKTE